jgi:hypothetical protein
MGHIAGSHYNKVVVELIKHDNGNIWNIFLVAWLSCPLGDHSSWIICLGLIPTHFIYMKLKYGCQIPPTCREWRIHLSKEVAEWEYFFL